MDPKSVKLWEFDIQEMLGNGAFGAVFRVKKEFDVVDTALKVMVDNSKYELEEVERFAKMARHPHLVAFKYAKTRKLHFKEFQPIRTRFGGNLDTIIRFQNEEKPLKIFCIQMELCGGDLRQWIDEVVYLSEKMNMLIFTQVLKGIKFLHEKGIIHRDIKPENIFFDLNDKKRVKIGDFGIATEFHDQNPNSMKTKKIGTAFYLAPEQETNNYGPKVDLYSLGIILLELFLAPKITYSRTSEKFKEIVSSIRKEEPKYPPEMGTLDQDISDHIKSLTQFNPVNRFIFINLDKISRSQSHASRSVWRKKFSPESDGADWRISQKSEPIRKPETIQGQPKLTKREDVLPKWPHSIKDNSSDEPAIGIDLGTTYSCVAIYSKGQVELLADGRGHRLISSFVCLTPGGGEVVGNVAKDQSYEKPQMTIFDAKRLIGRNFNETTVRADMELWPFRVVNKSGKAMVEVDGRKYEPELISSRLLNHLREVAQNKLRVPVSKAVITVPAYFNDSQRQATRDACVLAGLDVLKIINEPTAAAIAYNFDTCSAESKNVLIYDLGGGTFDVSILAMDKRNILVKAVGGDSHLGGVDFDDKLVEWCIKKFYQTKKLDLKDGAEYDVSRRLRRLRAECERRKMELSYSDTTTIRIEAIYKGQDLSQDLTRVEFDTMNKDSFKLTLKIVQNVLKDAKLRKDQIDEVVLVGGSTYILKIQEILTNFFDEKIINRRINADEAVCRGAALYAAKLTGKLRPNEDFWFLDVTPRSLGIELSTGEFSRIISRNTSIPIKECKDNFMTPKDDVTEMFIVIYEGEEFIAKNNRLLGKFKVKNIPRAKAGVQKFKIQMEIDENGILTVSAMGMNSDSSTKITIEDYRKND